jgi:hypothetical protein
MELLVRVVNVPNAGQMASRKEGPGRLQALKGRGVKLDAQVSAQCRLGAEKGGSWFQGNPLRWDESAGEDMPGLCRQGPGGRRLEDPKVRMKRTKGEWEAR